MSTFDASTLRGRLTPDRLGSYLRATAGDLDLAIMLYDWNISASGAFFEDIGRVEVVLRNALDQALSALGDRRGWPTPWYQRTALFPGAHGGRALDDIATARRRATRGGVPESHGKVMAELSFGFWRYLHKAVPDLVVGAGSRERISKPRGRGRSPRRSEGCRRPGAACVVPAQPDRSP